MAKCNQLTVLPFKGLKMLVGTDAWCSVVIRLQCVFGLQYNSCYKLYTDDNAISSSAAVLSSASCITAAAVESSHHD